MRGLRISIKNSSLPNLPLSTRQLATRLNVKLPLSIETILHTLDQAVQVIDKSMPVSTKDGSPLGGNVRLILRGDGSYTFSGDMRATGFTSYKYSLTVLLKSASGNVVTACKTGEVHGTDSSGSREDDWSQPGNNPNIKMFWSDFQSGATLEYHLDYLLSGTTGDLVDVLEFLGSYVAAVAVAGVAGAGFFVGTELAQLARLRVGTQGTLAGILVSGGMIWVLGPEIMLPAIVAGIVVGKAVDSDIKARGMNDVERDFARNVFENTIPYERITLTNLSWDGGRKYTIPSIDGSILMNMGDALDAPGVIGVPQGGPSAYSNPGSRYPIVGQTFIHELTHAWQIANAVFLPGLICDWAVGTAFGGLNYDYFDASKGRLNDTSWMCKPWTGFGIEQQAQIVDDWYGAFWHHGGLNGKDALSDPAFSFIQDNIRAQLGDARP